MDQMNEPVPNKNDGGALMFWSYHNQLQSQLERIDAAILSIARGMHEYRRRLTVLEKSVALHTKIIFDDQHTIQMTCISCTRVFGVPIAEAESQDFTTVCPECHNWALPVKETPKKYSIRQIAQISGFAYETVAQVIRENGFNQNQHGIYRQYDEETTLKVLAILKKKKPRRGAA
jgi:Zn finger protein HypA/HybF involved in hydrogenase expression